MLLNFCLSVYFAALCFMNKDYYHIIIIIIIIFAYRQEFIYHMLLFSCLMLQRDIQKIYYY